MNDIDWGGLNPEGLVALARDEAPKYFSEIEQQEEPRHLLHVQSFYYDNNTPTSHTKVMLCKVVQALGSVYADVDVDVLVIAINEAKNNKEMRQVVFDLNQMLPLM